MDYELRWVAAAKHNANFIDPNLRDEFSFGSCRPRHILQASI